MKAVRARAGLAALVALASFAVAGGAAAAAPPAHHPTAPHVKSAHFAFEGCAAATTVLTASMPRLSFTQHQAVTVEVTITNNASGSCGVPIATGPQGGVSLTIGPCSDLNLIIRNGTGTNVYPGNVVFHCPAMFGVSIPGHTSVSTTGSWNQRASYNSTKLAPRGTYKVSVAGKLTFTITLTGSSNGPLPALAEPPPFLPPSTVCSSGPLKGPQCLPIRIPNVGPLPVPSPCHPLYILITTPATPVPTVPSPCSTTVGPPPSGP